MRILHVSHGKLPDSRIEKVATYFKEKGHEAGFVGLKDSGTFRGPFESVDRFSMSMNAWHLVFNDRVKGRLRKYMRDCKPDIIHAHDAQVAIILFDTKVPFVFDDHEYLSRQLALEPARLKNNPVSNLARKSIRFVLREYVKSFETLTIRKQPTIVTNYRVQDAYISEGARWVGVVENFPAMWQLEHIDYDRYDRNGVVYAGWDFLPDRPQSPHRDMSGLHNFVRFEVVCGLSHQDMMQELTKYRFGIIGWKPHPVLDFKNQNKGYEYMHAGCQLIIPEQLAWQYADGLPWIHTFKSYSEIPSIIENAPDIDPEKIITYARQHYLWGSRSHVYEEAYKRALM